MSPTSQGSFLVTPPAPAPSVATPMYWCGRSFGVPQELGKFLLQQFTTTIQRMIKLVIGLQNPGPKYDGTRHNLGANIVRAWRGEAAEWKRDETLPADVSDGVVTCLLPLAGMNNSGSSVAAYMKNKPFDVSELLVVHDDLELPLGEVAHTDGGSAKGHNGVRSIQEQLGTTDIPRLRLGIGRPPEEVSVSDFVLSRFTSQEESVIETITAQATEVLSGLADE